jgi:NAD(P)-dependent dehydrogenase (short-subunit alcohol dehydrogenase family)
MTEPKPVCMVTGVGPEHGTGAEIARRFSEGGYRVAMLARNARNIQDLATKYPDAHAYPCDVSDLNALVQTIAQVKAEMGAPKIVVHNALRATRGSILAMDPDDLERNFRVNTTALLHLARETLPDMLAAGEGAILVTGNTSATRGKANWGFFASTKAAQRILAESMAREFGPRGVHVAYFVIDAAIDTPRTRPNMAEAKPDEFFAKPAAIAEEMFRVAHQDRSTWSFLVELRPFGEIW